MIRIVICLLTVSVTVAPAQDLDKSFRNAEKALRDLLVAATKANHKTRHTLETLVSNLNDIGDVYENERAARNAAKGPMVLFEMRLIETSPDTMKLLGVDNAGFLKGGTGAALLDDDVAARLVTATKDTTISAPKLLGFLGQQATMRIGSEKEVDWLERQPDGKYVMRKQTVEDMVTIGTRAAMKTEAEKRWLTIDVDLHVSMITGRTPIEAGADAIGLPITRTREASTKVTIPDNGHVLVSFNAVKDSPMWMLIHATIIDDKKGLQEPGRGK